jgi:large subunit ribosomal protein L25
MELQTLSISKRDKSGTGASRQNRMSGLVPGVIYGRGQSPASVTVNRKAFETAILRSGHGEHAVLQFECADDSALSGPVLIKAVQHHPVRETITHADFLRISLDERLRTLVPIELSGRAKGILDGGVADVQLHEIEIECLALQVPSKIVVDITDLGMGQSYHVSDIKVPEGITVVTDEERTVVAIHAPRAVKEEAEGAAEAAEGAAPAAGAAAPAAGAKGAAPAAPAKGAAAPAKGGAAPAAPAKGGGKK